VSQLGPSFPSFVNSIETAGEQESNLKMEFHNTAILKILGKSNSKDLHALLDTSSFTNQEQNFSLSLKTAASSRYSESIISEAYQFKVLKQVAPPENDNNNNNLAQGQNDAFVDPPNNGNSEGRITTNELRIISFIRNKVEYNGKKCIVLNVVDLTEQAGVLAC